MYVYMCVYRRVPSWTCRIVDDVMTLKKMPRLALPPCRSNYIHISIYHSEKRANPFLMSPAHTDPKPRVRRRNPLFFFLQKGSEITQSKKRVWEERERERWQWVKRGNRGRFTDFSKPFSQIKKKILFPPPPSVVLSGSEEREREREREM